MEVLDVIGSNRATLIAQATISPEGFAVLRINFGG